MTTIPAHVSNYTKNRTKTIDRIVVHYTAGDGDTAQNNGRYFSGANRNASAHYFVDETQVVQSVPDADTAWHAGNWAMNCRSLGVELCSKKGADGTYQIPDRTLQNAQTLIRSLMKKYDIPVEGVIRHYDVTGKLCPAPLVDQEKWQTFLLGLKAEETSWADEDRKWAVEQGLFRGDDTGEFRWKEPVSREQLAAVLRRFSQIT